MKDTVAVCRRVTDFFACGPLIEWVRFGNLDLPAVSFQKDFIGLTHKESFLGFVLYSFVLVV
ncbi:MAG: hypothetical protein PHF79_02895 [Candidatus Pacebacteria bacterium]|nr:hypothetical protein [Candidatus Paceibacterota bacterium]